MYPTAVGEEKAPANGNTTMVETIAINTSRQLFPPDKVLWASELMRVVMPNDRTHTRRASDVDRECGTESAIRRCVQ